MEKKEHYNVIADGKTKKQAKIKMAKSNEHLNFTILINRLIKEWLER